MRQSNQALRTLLTEARWTGDAFARQVNTLAQEVGRPAQLDRRSVSHWLAGRRPRDPLPQLAAEAFSRRLGRPLTPLDLGFGGSGGAGGTGRVAHAGLPAGAAADPLDLLGRLAGRGRDGARDAAGVFSLAALAAPSWSPDVFAAVMDHRPAKPGSTTMAPPRLDVRDAEAAALMARLFSNADSMFGGGQTHGALAAYLSRQIVPLLRLPGTRPVRARMLTAAVELTYLCGFMNFDDERHAASQRYYSAALSLATENEDPAAYAITLRAMSVQAHALGHHTESRSLAEAALTSAAHATLPAAQQAFLHGQLAVAAAATADRRTALSALARAERLLARPDPAPATPRIIGNYHQAALAHQESEVLTLLGDRAEGIRILSESIRRRPDGERRARAITLAKVAELHLDQGRLDESIAAWHAFVDDVPHLVSGRAKRALGTMTSRLRPHSGYHSARQLLRRAAAVPRP